MALSRRSLLIGTGTAAAAVGASGATSPAVAAGRGKGPGRSNGVRTGFDELAADGFRLLDGQRVGVVSNPTGITSDLKHIVDVMHADNRVNITAVFGPEHGFRGTAQAGDAEDQHDDPATGLPVFDTFQKSGQALAAILDQSQVDTVVFDIQDVGARFYTFIWTLFDCMESTAMVDKRFVVLDRPNPSTGRMATGPIMHPEFATFVGRKAISQSHGMTVAELAQLFNAEFLGGAVRLDVVTMKGWHRGDFFDSTGLPWVLPSPNMPTPDTALVYPGTCMFEGTNLSEGRGTTRPFELIGAEGVDGRWAESLNALDLAGARFREAYFAPTFSKFQGKTAGGVQIYVTDRERFDPVRTGIAMLITAKQVWSDFAWRPDNWIDKLTGSTQVRTMIDAGANTDEVVGAWQDELADFRAKRAQHLLYRN